VTARPGTATVGARDWLERAGVALAVPPGLAFADLTLDSRAVVPGALFLALPGTRQHGREFAAAAVAAGAVAVAYDAAEPAPAVPEDVPLLAVPGLARRPGAFAAAFYGDPSLDLRVTAITGTNGKTTVAWLLGQALEALGVAAGYVGTLGAGRTGAVAGGALTTPDCVSMHRLLRRLADAGARAVAAEVSSHALDQGRLDAVRTPVVAFTNLSRDHLDYHGTLERYGAAKARLFERGAGTAVINVGDAFGRRLAAGLAPGTALLGVALGGDEQPGAALRGQVVTQDAGGLVIEVWGDFGRGRLASPLWGRFNAENLLVALGCLLADGRPLGPSLAALGAATAPPGRLERVPGRVAAPAVVVDFAHTPDALAKALAAVRAHRAGRLWVVFGCGGERDPGKRGPMGAAAGAGADRVVITSDNPRGEDPAAIAAAIAAGVPAGMPVDVVPDRATAIRDAILAAGPDDVVLVAGKGHETYQEIAGQRRPFADAAVARAALEARQ
jgi:UDP-N-acetylmuramoyl-L-alanyl-D-glutamate--2,6-diaminopimelate ligase